MTDIPASIDKGTNKQERDLGKEFGEAAQFGRMAFAITDERTRNRYTLPFPNREIFSKLSMESLQPNGTAPTTETDVLQAQESAARLAIRIALQLAEASSRGPGIAENVESLENVMRLLARGHKLTAQLETQNPGAIDQLTVEEMARRNNVKSVDIKPGGEEQKKWREMVFQQAKAKLGRYHQAVKNVYGR